jgi:WD40 repeat protein
VFSADASMLFFADHCSVMAIDLYGEGRIALASHEQPIRALAISADGSSLASLDERQIILWDLATLTPRDSLTVSSDAHGGWLSLALSARGDRVYAAFRGGVEECRSFSGKPLRRFTIPELGSPRLMLADDDGLLVVTDANDMLYVIDLRKDCEAWHAGHSVPYHQGLVQEHHGEFAFQPPSYSTYDGPPSGGGGCCCAIPQPRTHVWCGNSDGTVLLWRLSTGVCEATLKVPFAVCLIDSFRDREGQSLVLTMGTQWKLGTLALRLFRAADRSELGSTEIAPCLVETLAVAPDGRQFATAARDGCVRLWDLYGDPGASSDECESARPHTDAKR